MRFFRRNRDEVDLDERSPQLGLKYKDLAVLGQLMKAGADLTQSRHVIYYLYASSEEVAGAIRAEAGSMGYEATVRDPLPEFPGQWAVVCETHTVLSPETVRDATDAFEELAERHGAEYDGWEAGV